MPFNISKTHSDARAAASSRGWERQVQRAGYRLTRPRRAVLRVMAHSEAALTATEVHDSCYAFHPQVGLVTVYRTLKLLVELGLVRRLRTEDGSQAYARADLRTPGHHLVCRSCHRVVEFPCAGLEEMIQTLEQRTARLCTGRSIGGKHLSTGEFHAARRLENLITFGFTSRSKSL